MGANPPGAAAAATKAAIVDKDNRIGFAGAVDADNDEDDNWDDLDDLFDKDDNNSRKPS